MLKTADRVLGVHGIVIRRFCRHGSLNRSPKRMGVDRSLGTLARVSIAITDQSAHLTIFCCLERRQFQGKRLLRCTLEIIHRQRKERRKSNGRMSPCSISAILFPLAV